MDELIREERIPRYVLARLRQSPCTAHPIKVLALTRPLITGAVLEARVVVCEMLSPLLCFGREMGVPDQIWTVDRRKFGCRLTC